MLFRRVSELNCYDAEVLIMLLFAIISVISDRSSQIIFIILPRNYFVEKKKSSDHHSGVSHQIQEKVLSL